MAPDLGDDTWHAGLWQAAVKGASLKGITEAEMMAIFHYITGQDGGKMKRDQLVEAITAAPSGAAAAAEIGDQGGRQKASTGRGSAASSVSGAGSFSGDRAVAANVSSAAAEHKADGGAATGSGGREVSDGQAVRLKVNAVTCLARLTSAFQVPLCCSCGSAFTQHLQHACMPRKVPVRMRDAASGAKAGKRQREQSAWRERLTLACAHTLARRVVLPLPCLVPSSRSARNAPSLHDAWEESSTPRLERTSRSPSTTAQCRVASFRGTSSGAAAPASARRFDRRCRWAWAAGPCRAGGGSGVHLSSNTTVPYPEMGPAERACSWWRMCWRLTWVVCVGAVQDKDAAPEDACLEIDLCRVSGNPWLEACRRLVSLSRARSPTSGSCI